MDVVHTSAVLGSGGKLLREELDELRRGGESSEVGSRRRAGQGACRESAHSGAGCLSPRPLRQPPKPSAHMVSAQRVERPPRPPRGLRLLPLGLSARVRRGAVALETACGGDQRTTVKWNAEPVPAGMASCQSDSQEAAQRLQQKPPRPPTPRPSPPDGQGAIST